MASKNNEEGSSEKPKGSSSSPPDLFDQNSVDYDAFLASVAYNDPQMISKLKDEYFCKNEWTQEEDTLLEGLLQKHATEPYEIERHKKIAKELKNRSPVEVGWRLHWLKFKKTHESK